MQVESESREFRTTRLNSGAEISPLFRVEYVQNGKLVTQTHGVEFRTQRERFIKFMNWAAYNRLSIRIEPIAK